MSDFVRVTEAADALGVKPATIRRYLEEGTLQGHVLPSGHRRISRESVDRVKDERREAAAVSQPSPVIRIARRRTS